MVHLSRIYTRTGDDGSTALGDGRRLPKHHLRIESYGTADELSSVLGLVRCQELPEPWGARLLEVQNDLFDVGSDLCVPGEEGAKLRLTPDYVQRLEGWIDEANAGLEPLNSFVLPGGSAASAWLHLARTVCRRGERAVTALGSLPEEAGRVNPVVVQYLNRLSDLLFVLSRLANDQGRADVLWVPGGNQRKD